VRQVKQNENEKSGKILFLLFFFFSIYFHLK